MIDIKNIFINILNEKDELGDIHPNQLRFLRSIASGETGFSEKERRKDTYNLPKSNKNVRDAMKAGMSLDTAQKKFGDYGNYQTNEKDVEDAKKLGVSPDVAKHLHGGGREGTSSLSQQTRATHEYISSNPKWNKSYEDLKSGKPEAYETARKNMGPPWFALKDNRKDVSNIIGTRTSGPAKGMLKTGPAPGSFRAAQQTTADVYPELNNPPKESLPSNKPKTIPAVTSRDRTDFEKTIGPKIPDVEFIGTNSSEPKKINNKSNTMPTKINEPPKPTDQYTDADKLGANNADLMPKSEPEEKESGGRKKKVMENKKYISLEHSIRNVVNKNQIDEGGPVIAAIGAVGRVAAPAIIAGLRSAARGTGKVASTVGKALGGAALDALTTSTPGQGPTGPAIDTSAQRAAVSATTPPSISGGSTQSTSRSGTAAMTKPTVAATGKPTKSKSTKITTPPKTVKEENVEEMYMGSMVPKGNIGPFAQPIPLIGPSHSASSKKISGKRRTYKQTHSTTKDAKITEDNVPAPNIGNIETVAKLSASGAAQEDGYIARKGKRKEIEYVGRSENPKSKKSKLGRNSAVTTRIIDEDFLNDTLRKILKKKEEESQKNDKKSSKSPIKLNPMLVTPKDE